MITRTPPKKKSRRRLLIKKITLNKQPRVVINSKQKKPQIVKSILNEPLTIYTRDGCGSSEEAKKYVKIKK